MLYLSTFFASFLLVLALTPFFIKLAFKKNFLDYPDPRKVHSRPTPLLGGASVFLGFSGGVLLSLLSGIRWTNELSGVFLGGLVILGLGLLDDKKGMSPGVKFLGQIVASFVFLLATQSFGILGFGFLGDILFLLWMVGLMNAFNFLDNMDGLCSGISFIATAAFFLIFVLTDQFNPAIICLSLMGSLLGFLIYNFTPAKIFLGDAGSMFNGFILSALGIFFAKRNSSFNQLLAPILILSYPIFDISLVTFTRLREGREIYKGGKDHSSHRFMNLGFHLKKTLSSIFLINLGLGIIALLVFFLIESPWKILIAFCVGILLAILGTHLHRRFARVGEKLSLILVDIISVNASFLFFYWLRFKSGFFGIPIVIPLSEYIIPAIWITFYWLILFAILGLYEINWEFPLRDEWIRVAKAVALGIMIFSILSVSFISLRFVFLYTLSLGILLLLLRTLFILTERYFNSRRIGLRKSLILGTNQKAQELNRFLQTESNPGFKVLGVVSEDKNYPEGLKVLGDVDDLESIVKKTKAEVLFFYLKAEEKGAFALILKNLDEVEVDIVIKEEMSDIFWGMKKSKFYKGPWLKVYPLPLRVWEVGVKRMLDFFVSFILIVAVSPVLLSSSFLVSVNFSGGILLKRKVLGKGGRVFDLYTFNSGPVDSPNPFSRFLRSSKLDKLPLLFNILKGEMSLVGPQPLEEKVNIYSTGLSDYYKRIDLKPGIFSLSQDRKESISFSENILRRKIEDALVYAERISLWLDFKIILSQISNLFLRRQNV
jgi:UDP-GlcNAc:undecaprenyl-phosphate GlcNAc-1-phosphate transferase